MFSFQYRFVCLCLSIYLIEGKAVDLEFGYQEITYDLVVPHPDMEETKYIEIDKISDALLEEMCKNFQITIHIKETNSYVNCLDNFYDNTREVNVVKRDVSDTDKEVEGSGDSDEQTVRPTEIAKETESAPLNKETQKESPTTTSSTTSTSTITTVTSEDPTQSGAPVMFQGGFDHILKNTPKELDNSRKLFENGKEENIIMAADGKSPSATGEIAKTGESKEDPTAASPNSILLIVIAALGIIGTLAFAFNYIKKKREEKEVDEVMKLETEGKELKEMKPLMKNPLQQNGARSLEYIDAEPQDENISDTKVEVIHEEDIGRNSR